MAVAGLVLAGCGGGSGGAITKDAHAAPRPTGSPPPQFGTGDDPERASELATKVLRRKLARQGIVCESCLYGSTRLTAAQRHMKRFLLHTEATSSTRTHLLVQFDGRVVWPQSRKQRYVEYRVLIAVRPHNTLAVSTFSEHTVPRSRVDPRRSPDRLHPARVPSVVPNRADPRVGEHHPLDRPARCFIQPFIVSCLSFVW